MKALRILTLALLCTLPLTSCSTANLIAWGSDDNSIYNEPDGEFSRGMLKPLVTVVGFPVAVVWDVVTFPFQIIFGVHPYGERYMAPDSMGDL